MTDVADFPPGVVAALDVLYTWAKESGVPAAHRKLRDAITEQEQRWAAELAEHTTLTKAAREMGLGSASAVAYRRDQHNLRT